MRSVVPSDSATVPLPDHVPSNPANGPDWAWLADTESISAAPRLAALIARPKRLEPNRFILRFPVKNDVLDQDTSRRIKVLVSPNYIRFKPSRSGEQTRLRPVHGIARKIHRRVCAGEREFREVSRSRHGSGI